MRVNIFQLLGELLPAILAVVAMINAKGGHGDFVVSIDVKDKATGAALLDQQVTEVSF